MRALRPWWPRWLPLLGVLAAAVVNSGSGVVTGCSSPPEPTELELEDNDVGKVEVYDSKRHQARLRNVSEERLILERVSVEGDFQVEMQVPMRLAPGESAAVTVIFSPTWAGLHTGGLVFSRRDGRDLGVGLKGTAFELQRLGADAQLDLGRQHGDPIAGALNVWGAAHTTQHLEVDPALDVRGCSASRRLFCVEDATFPLELHARERASLTVAFDPRSVPRGGTVTRRLGLRGCTHHVECGIEVLLSATVVPEPLECAPALDLGAVEAGRCAMLALTCTSAVDRPVAITALNLGEQPSPFAVGTPDRSLLPAHGARLEVDVTFCPPGVGTFEDTLSVVSAGGDPVDILLRARGL